MFVVSALDDVEASSILVGLLIFYWLGECAWDAATHFAVLSSDCESFDCLAACVDVMIGARRRSCDCSGVMRGESESTARVIGFFSYLFLVSLRARFLSLRHRSHGKRSFLCAHFEWQGFLHVGHLLIGCEQDSPQTTHLIVLFASDFVDIM